LKNRMQAIAPNLSIMVGKLVGARLIAHAGSLMSLAKYPASTVQILGAEKALFRALKTKHETPKYGLIYHASLVGQASPKMKGKVSRMVAAKTALATRVDALAENVTMDIGITGRAKVEARMRTLEAGHVHAISGTARTVHKTEKYDNRRSAETGQKRASVAYNPVVDSTLGIETPKKEEPNKKKRKRKDLDGKTKKEKKGKKGGKETEKKEDGGKEEKENEGGKKSKKKPKKAKKGDAKIEDDKKGRPVDGAENQDGIKKKGKGKRKRDAKKEVSTTATTDGKKEKAGKDGEGKKKKKKK